ncbi:MAG: hypothetical protein MK008_10280 [Bdellovibrionales bacterium]|nr:hypothetical protein [Bdellovibrionales bacterium]
MKSLFLVVFVFLTACGSENTEFDKQRKEQVNTKFMETIELFKDKKKQYSKFLASNYLGTENGSSKNNQSIITFNTNTHIEIFNALLSMKSLCNSINSERNFKCKLVSMVYDSHNDDSLETLNVDTDSPEYEKYKNGEEVNELYEFKFLYYDLMSTASFYENNFRLSL